MTKFLKEFMSKRKSRGNRKPKTPSKDHPYRVGLPIIRKKTMVFNTPIELGLPKKSLRLLVKVNKGFKLESARKGVNEFPKCLKVALSCLFLAIIAGCSTPSFAYTDEEAIKAIIGEAENQGYEGMLAVACAIRNRGSLKGVYGINAPRVKRVLYTKGTWIQAKEAWDSSEKLILWGKDYDISHGANSWENLHDFGKPYWADSCEQTVIIKDHVFFKCPTS